MFFLLHSLPIVERLGLDGLLKLFSSFLHALSFLCRLNVMGKSWQEVRSVTVTPRKSKQPYTIQKLAGLTVLRVSSEERHSKKEL